ncbi:hypothetical protein Tco_0545858 [Tanacetum coccineum]
MPRTMGTNNDEAGSSRSKRSRHETVKEVLLPQVHHEFLLWEGCNRDAKSRMDCDGEINDMLRIRLREAESKEEKFYLCADDELQTKKIIKFRLGGRAHSLTLWSLLDNVKPSDERDLDTTTLRDLIDSDGKLIPEDPQPGVPKVGIPRPPRASIQDLYDKMGRIEIRQETIERMEYRQLYHWDKYQGVFEHMARVYSVSMQGAYNPPGYAQSQYDQYYQQYQPLPPQYQQQQQDDDEYCRDGTRLKVTKMTNDAKKSS